MFEPVLRYRLFFLRLNFIFIKLDIDKSKSS